MRFHLIAATVLVAAATPAWALPELDPAAEAYCQGYAETIEGVWADADGKEVLRFRLALNEDGTGCYAWLNSVPQWGITESGMQEVEKITRDGVRRNWGRPGSNGVFVNLATGTCSYKRDQARAEGRVIEVKN